MMHLFHGSDDHNNFGKIVYFSTSMDFSSDYGEVRLYEVNMKKTFDTLNKQHVRMLFELKGALYEPYDELEINSYEEYLNSVFYGSDNWELFEQYTQEINRMGFDSIRIFEGGIENYAVFNKRFGFFNAKFNIVK